MTRWLSADQQRIWRDWLTTSELLDHILNSELQASHGLSLGDYEILVRLSESPKRRIRMSELAEKVLISRSRLSHQIDRMQEAGLVDRQICDDDRRGQFAVLTDHGWKALVSAAHVHVSGVRNHFVDILTDAEYAALGRAVKKLAAYLDDGNETSKAK
ncbi:MAG: MarR family transcriptional regulator [Actinobacteria bacterium]|nr:MarR family transcriptional regulator [Actinomycetota bacterium]